MPINFYWGRVKPSWPLEVGSFSWSLLLLEWENFKPLLFSNREKTLQVSIALPNNREEAHFSNCQIREVDIEIFWNGNAKQNRWLFWDATYSGYLNYLLWFLHLYTVTCSTHVQMSRALRIPCSRVGDRVSPGGEARYLFACFLHNGLKSRGTCH